MDHKNSMNSTVDLIEIVYKRCSHFAAVIFNRWPGQPEICIMNFPSKNAKKVSRIIQCWDGRGNEMAPFVESKCQDGTVDVNRDAHELLNVTASHRPTHYSRNRGINDSCYYCSPFWPGMRVNDYSGDDEENHATNNWPRVAGAGHRLCGCCGGDRIGHRQQRQQFPGSHPTTLFRWVQGSRYYISSVGLSVWLSIGRPWRGGLSSGDGRWHWLAGWGVDSDWWNELGTKCFVKIKSGVKLLCFLRDWTFRFGKTKGRPPAIQWPMERRVLYCGELCILIVASSWPADGHHPPPANRSVNGIYGYGTRHSYSSSSQLRPIKLYGPRNGLHHYFRRCSCGSF